MVIFDISKTKKQPMNTEKKILIGGKALNFHGSNRLTSDTDYMIFDESNFQPFFADEANNTDYINGNGHNFFEKIWNAEKGSAVASPASLLELKAYSYIQHLQNGKFQKAADADYDMKFLIIKFGLSAPVIVKNYLSASEYYEITTFYNSIKK